jgi:hypothetical protein
MGDQNTDMYIQNKLHDFSLHANYTDRATTVYRRSLVPLLQIDGVAWSAQRIPMAVNFGFLDQSSYFLDITPELSS